jgi:hypothetical protein
MGETEKRGTQKEAGETKEAVERQAEGHQEATERSSGADREEVDETTRNPAPRHGPRPAGP